ncbi:hypothetical protein FNV43_RR05465 [Rhamnella rubrinervis]|uniref:Root cap n=1 Tax=Rhamnella rubrinervis TaxID=2594499 RepID=A0A8K0MQP1_9ROSA|nr:hypothetical protein FNV43_RR05465 [Rhamnella rubrinervis]
MAVLCINENGIKVAPFIEKQNGFYTKSLRDTNEKGNGDDGKGNDDHGDDGNGSGGGNGNGNTGGGHGEGNNSKGNGNGNGNGTNGSGNSNGNGNNGRGNDNGNGNENGNMVMETAMAMEMAMEVEMATVRKPMQNKDSKGCFIDCSTKCEATCMSRKPNCNGYGSLCYDPRFVGADGVVFYFHGSKGGNFAIVSDENFQINAHFIGTRPQGRTRDFTWVQALSIMFESHTFAIAAKRVSHWDDKVDALIVSWDGESVNIPTDGDAEWRTNGEEREVLVERTDNTNNVKVKVTGLVEIHIKVRPIGKEENRVHNYRLPSDDAFGNTIQIFESV